MKTIFPLIFHGALIAILISGGGLANLAIAVFALTVIIVAFDLSAGLFGDVKGIRARAMKVTAIPRRVMTWLLTWVFIAVAAYQGYVGVSVFIAVAWIYCAVVLQAIKKDEARKATEHEAQQKQWQELKRGRVD